MSDSPVFPFGYCTNVHAGITLDQAKANLLKYASPVRDQVIPDGTLPIGLWLAEEAAEGLMGTGRVQELKDWLQENRFAPYTFNGFPQGDFHQAVVKHRVYEPTWSCPSRLRYTLMLTDILEALLDPGGRGSISTLPLGWPHAPWHADDMKSAADQLLEVAKHLDRIWQTTGKEIVVAIEPEPGCVLDTANDILEFFEHYLLSGPLESIARRHLSICHDICHSCVMFESQQAVLTSYRDAGIRVGKVQVSSAIHVPWDRATTADQKNSLLDQLRSFNEPKYLHQTSRQAEQGGLAEMSEDLPQALEQWNAADQQLPWRVHFHVPIYAQHLAADSPDGSSHDAPQAVRLATTQTDIAEATQEFKLHGGELIEELPWFSGHYEVETYAWTVLPDDLAPSNLATGIARELAYFNDILGA